MALRTDYETLLVQLLPRGRAFEGPRLRAFFGAFAGELARVDGRSHQLAHDEIPDEPNELLPEWERILGITEPSERDAGRRGLVRGKLSAVGGQSERHYLELIRRTTGDEAKINRFETFVAGRPCGRPLFGSLWRHVWQVVNISPEHLETVETLVAPNSQAHTVVMFSVTEVADV